MGTITGKEGNAKYFVRVNGVRIDYRYRSRWLDLSICAYDHFEFLSDHLSETGYLSRFVPFSEIVEVGGVKNRQRFFVRQVLKLFDLFSFLKF